MGHEVCESESCQVSKQQLRVFKVINNSRGFKSHAHLWIHLIIHSLFIPLFIDSFTHSFTYSSFFCSFSQSIIEQINVALVSITRCTRLLLKKLTPDFWTMPSCRLLNVDYRGSGCCCYEAHWQTWITPVYCLAAGVTHRQLDSGTSQVIHIQIKAFRCKTTS